MSNMSIWIPTNMNMCMSLKRVEIEKKMTNDFPNLDSNNNIPRDKCNISYTAPNNNNIKN